MEESCPPKAMVLPVGENAQQLTQLAQDQSMYLLFGFGQKQVTCEAQTSKVQNSRLTYQQKEAAMNQRREYFVQSHNRVLVPWLHSQGRKLKTVGT